MMAGHVLEVRSVYNLGECSAKYRSINNVGILQYLHVVGMCLFERSYFTWLLVANQGSVSPVSAGSHSTSPCHQS